MTINFVSRKNVEATGRSSKYKQLIQAIQKIKGEDKAVEVSFKERSQLNAIRNAVYRYNNEQNDNIKSRKHPDKNVVFFYK